MTADQIKELVNAAYEGVDRSIIGPIFIYPDTKDIEALTRQKQMSQPAFGAFTIVLTGLMRKVGGENGKI